MADLSILVKILAQNNASGALRAVRGDLEHMGVAGAKTGGILGTVGGLAAGAAIGGVAVLGGALGFAVNAASGFEERMSAVKAVSGATGEEFNALSALAMQLGKDTVFSANEAAAGIEELVKGGIQIPDILNGAAGAMLNLAAAGGVELPEAAIIMSNAMNMFGLQGRDAAHVADLIAGAANASSLDVRDFGFSLAQAGAMADITGLSFDDLAIAIALMGAAGIRGSDAGTSLKTMFARLTPDTAKARGLFKELGLMTEDGRNKFFDLTGTMKPLPEVMGMMNSALAKLTPLQRQMALETIFGSDAIRAGAILSEAGTEGYENMAAAMGKVTAATVAGEKLNNLRGDLKMLGGSVETAAIALGSALMPALRELAQGFTEMVNQAIPWIQEHGPAMAQSAMGMVQAFLPWVQEHGPKLIAGFIEVGGQVLSVIGALAGLVGTGASVAGWATGVWQNFQDILMKMHEFSLVGFIGDAFMAGFEALVSWVRVKVNELITLFNQIPFLPDVGYIAAPESTFVPTPITPPFEQPPETGQGEFAHGGVVPGIGPMLVTAHGGELIARPVESPVSVGMGGVGGPSINVGPFTIAGLMDFESAKQQIIDQFTQELDMAFEIARGMGTSTPIALQNRT